MSLNLDRPDIKRAHDEMNGHQEKTDSKEITLWREFNARDVNKILNHPDVFPLIKVPGVEKFDATPLLADPLNYCLCVEGGCIIFSPESPGSQCYEFHTTFLPTHHSFYAAKASMLAYRWMFTHTDCMLLQVRVPEINKAAYKYAHIVGPSLWFERKKAWETDDGPVDIRFFLYPYLDWLKKEHDWLVECGKRFHDHLETEKERAGNPGPAGHPDDDWHNLHVGACVQMIHGGQPVKAVELYNRWARFGGYEQVKLLSLNPTVIDIGDCVLMAQDQGFKVLLCRSAQQ